MIENQKDDRQQILNHIHAIFQAFLNRDRETIKNLHSKNWIGFMGPSTGIERGIDAYMTNVDKSLDNFKGTDYELYDSEVQIHGNIAIVYYVARYDYAAENEQTHSIPLRSVDIYHRERDGWIQVGSHITVIPSEGAWGEGKILEKE